MSKDLILIAAIGAAVFLVLSKQAQAGAVTVSTTRPLTNAEKANMGLIYTAPQQQSANIMGDMWTRLMGDGWRNLVSAQNDAGGPAFIYKNSMGQIVTGDGKPVAGDDPQSAYFDVIAGLPTSGETDYLGMLEQFDYDQPLTWQ